MNGLRGQFPDLALGNAILFSGLAAASRPIESLTVTEHAERYRKVSPESGSPWPGDFRVERVPYIREPQDCLHPDHPARRVTLRWAAQLGKSTIIENWFCFIVDQAPGSMMIVLPTLDEATKFNRVKLGPTIEASKRIAHKVLPVASRDEQGSTTAFKKFAGGFAQIVNAGSSKGLQMVTIKYLAMDEVTGYPLDVDGRGSPRVQARSRQKMYGDLAKEFECSTPGIAGECVITEDFEAGDRRFLYVKCPLCRAYQPLWLENLVGPNDTTGMPAHFRCLACGGAIVEGCKQEMLLGGQWIGTRVRDGEPPVPEVIPETEIARWICEPCEGRCRAWQPSYHLPAFYAPRERWADIWSRWQDAQGDSTKMRTFCQQDDAQPYDPGGVAIEWEKILAAARVQPLPRGRVPAWAALVVSAADVQGYGIKWAVYAIGPRGQRAVIDREVFEGAPDQSDEPWVALADALGRTYRTAGSEEKGIDLSGVDSGFATDRVYRFCAGRANVYALDGRHPVGLPWLGSPVKRDIKDRIGRVVAKVMLYPVGLYDVKTEVVAGLANLVQGPDAKGAWPRNTLHIAADLCDEGFCQELTAERLVDPDEDIRARQTRNKKKLIAPKAAREWKRIVGRANDWFDVSVYAFALGWHLEHKMRLDAGKWADLTTRVHGVTEPATLFDLESPFASQSAKQANQAAPRRRSLAEIAARMNG